MLRGFALSGSFLGLMVLYISLKHLFPVALAGIQMPLLPVFLLLLAVGLWDRTADLPWSEKLRRLALPLRQGAFGLLVIEEILVIMEGLSKWPTRETMPSLLARFLFPLFCGVALMTLGKPVPVSGAELHIRAWQRAMASFAILLFVIASGYWHELPPAALFTWNGTALVAGIAWVQWKWHDTIPYVDRHTPLPLPERRDALVRTLFFAGVLGILGGVMMMLQGGELKVLGPGLASAITSNLWALAASGVLVTVYGAKSVWFFALAVLNAVFWPVATAVVFLLLGH